MLPNTEKGRADWSDRVTDEEYNNSKEQYPAYINP